MAMEAIFVRLLNIIKEQETIIKSISDKIDDIKTGSIVIKDYVSNKLYERNVLFVDTDTETVYRSLKTYTSKTIDEDISDGNIKLVGFESQLVTFDHNPSQSEISTLPDDALVAIYSKTDAPYVPDAQ